MQEVTYTLVMEVRNKPGVLVRIAHVFARRGCNIQSLHVQPHGTDEAWSTMTIAVKNVSHIEQIIHQLQKLVDVARVDVHNAVKEFEK
jgi:acetolactate synthase I/III small subunit